MVVLNEALVRVKTKQEDLNEVKSKSYCSWLRMNAPALHVVTADTVGQSCSNALVWQLVDHTDQATGAMSFSQT
jgi:hypothetical protein